MIKHKAGRFGFVYVTNTQTYPWAKSRSYYVLMLSENRDITNYHNDLTSVYSPYNNSAVLDCGNEFLTAVHAAKEAKHDKT